MRLPPVDTGIDTKHASIKIGKERRCYHGFICIYTYLIVSPCKKKIQERGKKLCTLSYLRFSSYHISETSVLD